MSDIGLIWKDGEADILLNEAENDLQNGHELKTAIIVSLFTDHRATLNDDPPDKNDLRGWWSDNEVGSLLWLLERQKATEQNLEKGRQYIKNSLQWLLNQGIASNVTVSGFIENLIRFRFEIKITRSQNSKYAYLWNDIQTELFKFNRSSFTISFE